MNEAVNQLNGAVAGERSSFIDQDDDRAFYKWTTLLTFFFSNK